MLLKIPTSLSDNSIERMHIKPQKRLLIEYLDIRHGIGTKYELIYPDKPTIMTDTLKLKTHSWFFSDRSIHMYKPIVIKSGVMKQTNKRNNCKHKNRHSCEITQVDGYGLRIRS